MNHGCHDCLGSAFDEFLKEDGAYEACQASAIKRVIAWHLSAFIKTHGLTKAETARRLGTSRSFVDKLLDVTNTSITLATILKVARVIGKPVRIEFGEGEGNDGSVVCHG